MEMGILFAGLISSSLTAFLTDVWFLLLKRRDEVSDQHLGALVLWGKPLSVASDLLRKEEAGMLPSSSSSRVEWQR